MKKILFICTMILLSSIGINAQQRGNREDMERRQKERMDNYIKELKLDTRKAADFKKIMDESQELSRREMTSARESGNFDREAWTAKMTKLNADRDAKIKKILSADEYKKYEELVKAEQSRFGQGGGQRRQQ